MSFVSTSKSPLSMKEELSLPTRKEKGHPGPGNGIEIAVGPSERYWVWTRTRTPLSPSLRCLLSLVWLGYFITLRGGEHKSWKWMRQIILLHSNVRGFCSIEAEIFVKQITWGISSYWHSQKSVCVYFFEKTNQQTKTATKIQCCGIILMFSTFLLNHGTFPIILL